MSLVLAAIMRKKKIFISSVQKEFAKERVLLFKNHLFLTTEAILKFFKSISLQIV